VYEQHYGLQSPPFAITPDPSCVFLTAAHREALSGLSYTVTRRKGFAILVGEAGTGKTTLLRKLLKTLPAESVYTAFILNPTVTPSEFLELLLADLGVESIPESKSGKILALHHFLLNASREGKTVILLVDEAQKLSPETLEEIRLLSNFETAHEKLLQIILAGQPEFNNVINREDLRQLKQRVALRLHIGPIPPTEVLRYMSYRWMQGGATRELPFTADAVNAITVLSHGIPRLINTLCDNALMLAVALDRETVDAAQVADVARDLDMAVPLAATPKPVTQRLPEAPRSVTPVPQRPASNGTPVNRAPLNGSGVNGSGGNGAGVNGSGVNGSGVNGSSVKIAAPTKAPPTAAPIATNHRAAANGRISRTGDILGLKNPDRYVRLAARPQDSRWLRWLGMLVGAKNI